MDWHVISHSPTKALHTIAVWSTMGIIGVQLILDGEFAPTLVFKNHYGLDNGLFDEYNSNSINYISSLIISIKYI